MSFRSKTIIGIALIEAVLLYVLVWSGLRYIEDSNQREFVQRVQATIDAFAVTVKDAVLASDLASLESFVAEVMTFPGVTYARVLDYNDRVLASAGADDMLQRSFKTDVTLADVDDGVFDTYARIVEAGSHFGTVQAGLSVDALRRVIADARQFGISIALVEMALVALFSFVLGLYLTRQLSNLADGAQRIARGEWGHQVPVRGDDELGATARAFNLMSSRIKLAYEETADRERNLRTILENITDGIMLTDSDGRVVERNPAARAIFGLGDESPDSAHLASMIAHEDWQAIEALLHDATSSVWGSTHEVTGIRNSGQRFPMELTLSRSGQQSETALIAVVRDISERKSVEEELRLQERVLDTTRAGVVIADAKQPDLPLVYVNPAFEKITGYRADEVIGRNCRFLQGADTDPEARATIRLALGNGEDVQILIKNYRADGVPFWNDLQITPIRNAEGELTHFVGLQNDVTERVENQHEIANQEARLRGVLDSTHDAIIVTDTFGIIESFNLGAEKMFGHRADDVIGQNVSILVPQPHQAQHDEYLHRYRETGESHIVGKEREFEARHADGHAFPIALRVSEMLDGDHRHFIGVIHDITERKQKELALQRAKEVAEEAAAAKSQFLANMSHEIRTPMHGVLGALEMMRDTPLNRVQKRYLETANSSADVLLTVIDEILDFSRLEAGKLRIEKLEFESRKAVEDVIAMLGQSAFDKGLELVSYISPEVPDLLRGDPIRLRQILINLVGNAVKFTERGEIVVNVSVDLGGEDVTSVLFEVRDTGIGVAEDKREHLFEAFSQADGSTSRRFGGTGLGLSISRRLVELMNGEIGVVSREGTGSTFWFRLPFEAVTRRDTAAHDQDFTGRRMLIVDDNATNRIIMHRYLASWGSSPGSASDGFEALAKMQDSAASDQPYDLAILDYRMPGMSGLELARRVREDEKLRRTRLIMVSSENYSEQVDGEVLVDIWLNKPLRQSDLHDAIATTLGELNTYGSPPKPHNGKVNFNGEKVLLAEDNPVSQSLALEMLRQRGLDVQSAANGAEAVELARTGDFDVILMDVQMPEMDGYEATRRILDQERVEQRRHTPIIALTAHALPQDRERCIAAGMDDYLVKPFSQESLSNMIFRWLSPPAPSNGNGALRDGPLDAEKITEIRAMMGEKFAVLLGQFRAAMSEQLERIENAAGESDFATMREAVHRVKNNAGDFGANRLLQIAGQMERVLQDQRPDDDILKTLLLEGRRVVAAADVLQHDGTDR